MTADQSAKLTASRPTRRDDLDVLKVFACLLITNSHCRAIYPLYFLAIGGGHGNGLFFIVSGFLLGNIRLPFGAWMKKRVLRILPVTLLFAAFSVFVTDGLSYYSSLGIWNACATIINKYWFAAAIMLFYPIYYLVFSSGNRRTAWTALFVYAVGYALIYAFLVDKTVFSVEPEGFAPFKVYFYFGVMLAGGLLRRMTDANKTADSPKRLRAVSLLCAAAAFALWTVVYALITLKGMGLSVQFLIHVGVMAFSVAMFVFAGTFTDFRLPDSRAGRVLRIAAASTLEIYLVQVTIQPYMSAMPFPLNWAAFFISAFAGGMLLHQAVDALSARRIRAAYGRKGSM